VPTEAQAREAIRDINKGQSMEELVRQSSTDPSRANGGRLTWPNFAMRPTSSVLK
jgi:parvulin-like peptidyl-prolyl isomerase